MGMLPKDRHHPPPPANFSARKLVSLSVYALLALAFFHFYFIPRLYLSPPLPVHIAATAVTVPPSVVTQRRTIGTAPRASVATAPSHCDLFAGRWVKTSRELLYNGSSCATIKEGQNCMAHGRPDTGYLHWRWQPRGCALPTFDASAFLRLLRDRHLAFIGDSMARNQLESLLCLLATASPPDLVYRDGEDNRFRRWRFPSYDAKVSVFWSPFLVRGVEKSPSGLDHNGLYLDEVDERWASELGSMDVIVLSVGHWFLHPAVFYEKGGTVVVGCHYCPNLNHTEVGFYGVYQKAFQTALYAAVTRTGANGRSRYVVVPTFSPSHFEGEWDRAGACPRLEPYEEKTMEGMDAEMRRVQLEEVAAARARAPAGATVEALDVTGLALLRADGHPGPYMYANPFANGVPERVQNDCVHWCLPGPIDAWNEIFLEMVRGWTAVVALRLQTNQ